VRDNAATIDVAALSQLRLGLEPVSAVLTFETTFGKPNIVSADGNFLMRGFTCIGGNKLRQNVVFFWLGWQRSELVHGMAPSRDYKEHSAVKTA
jgi:hypothetical protein